MTDTVEINIESMSEWIAEARRLSALFRSPIWAGTAEQTDEEHNKDHANTLAITRAHFGLREKTRMHFVMEEETEAVIAFTGTSPEAAERARAIAGVFRSLPAVLDGLEAAEAIGARVVELLQHNNDQLMENRAQRETIRQQQAKIDWLMSKIPGVEAA